MGGGGRYVPSTAIAIPAIAPGDNFGFVVMELLPASAAAVGLDLVELTEVDAFRFPCVEAEWHDVSAVIDERRVVGRDEDGAVENLVDDEVMVSDVAGSDDNILSLS
jgi:hypothetical protein